MNIISIVEQKIKNYSFKKIFFILFSLMVVKTGIWCIPNIGASFLIAQNPFLNPFADPNAHYLMSSWLSSFVSWILHLKRLSQYFIFHFICSLAYLALFAQMILKKMPLVNAKKALILFFLFPFSATSFFWVGMDSGTLLLMMLSFYFYKNIKLSFLFAILLGLQHFEQGFFSAIALLFPMVLNQYNGTLQDYKLKNISIYILGILFGKLILVYLFKHNGIILVNNRALLAKSNFQIYTQQFFNHFQIILWSIFGVGWFVFFRYFQINRTQLSVLISIASIFLLITPVIGDQTRVDCIILFPLILVYVLLNERFLQEISLKDVSKLLLWFVIPWLWVWEGQPKWSVFPYDIYFIVHKIFHGLTWPANPFIYPFI